MATGKPVVGIDLGGTNMQIGVVNPDFSIRSRAKRKTKAAEGLDAVVQRIVEGVEEACQGANLQTKDLAAVGIGAPGAIDPRQGLVLEAVNLRWTNVPLCDLLSQKLGVPVILDNDVNAAIYGENRLGAGENARDLLGVWIGTGIGGGLILNGQLYYGTFFTAGEIGHTTLVPNNPPGSRSLEHNTSRSAIVERLIRLIRANRPSIIPSLVDGNLSDVKSKTIAKAYNAGDELTIEVVDSAADLLGIAIANTVTLLSLGRVVVGGGLTEALGESLVEKIRHAVRTRVFPDVCRKVEVVGTRLEDDAGVLGAALLAYDHIEG
jgi:glucokinase